MAKLINREVILAKIESTYGTDASPDPSTDAMLVEGISPGFEGARMQERSSIVRPSKGTLKQLYGGSLRSLSFSKEIKGSGDAADTPPEIGRLLRAAGFGETINAGTSVVYEPVSEDLESLTIYWYEDGDVHKMTGCRASSVSLNMETGSRGMMEFTFVGHYSTPTAEALPTPTYEDSVPPIVIDAGFDIGGFSGIIQSLSLDMGLSTVMPPDMNASDGYGEILIQRRDPNGTINPETPLASVKDFITEWQNMTEQALTTGVLGSTAGNQYQIDMPAVAAREPGHGEREQIRVTELTYGAAEVDGDDDVTITFT